LANLTSKPLALHLDSKLADGFFWYGEHYFMKWDLVRLLNSLHRLRPGTIIYPNYSRRFTVDWLIKQVKAKNKIAVDGDTINQPAVQKARTDQYYTQLINVAAGPRHEFERNKQVFERITGEKCDLQAPYIDRGLLHIVPGDRIIIFTGASTPDKTWSPANFNALCKQILRDTSLNILLINGKDAHEGADEIMAGLAQDRASMLPDTGLVTLCELIGGARLVVTGDTAAVHIAAALAVPAVCIAKGDLYGRFIPYPPEMSDKIHCVFPRSYREDMANYSQYTSCTLGGVSPEMVCHVIEKILTAHQLSDS
jgi:ADP-heptose:LPS heptosyltransferase